MAHRQLPTGTVTFLFTDIEGSSQKWELHPGAMTRALKMHDRLLREVVKKHGGHVFKTVGDEFLLRVCAFLGGRNRGNRCRASPERGAMAA